MNLLDAKIGNEYEITSIELEHNVKRRLEMLGMTNGTKLLVLNKKHGGAIIIKVRGTRFALGKRFAEGIFTREES